MLRLRYKKKRLLFSFFSVNQSGYSWCSSRTLNTWSPLTESWLISSAKGKPHQQPNCNRFLISGRRIFNGNLTTACDIKQHCRVCRSTNCVRTRGYMCELCAVLCYHLDLSSSASAFITTSLFVSVIPPARLCIITV